MAVGSKELTVDKLATLENSARLKAVKRDIARIYTVVRERELGIREAVSAPAGDEDTEED